ncbi:protein-lysine methyltransferase METTL21C-like [Phyllopteryx taeniolatus]|uniref:protein-lysine methyltransferase METTL21C-like n=1 Tax=Phyllopteryx taeniolatus TaxID=161469 RepID=UPI002AD44C79|nr:protein-lysine methyltransferase METTL21C-like [Phyllopteryx taeniolatus]
MDTLSTYSCEANSMTSVVAMEDDEEQKEELEESDSEVAHKQQKQGWTPCFFFRTDKEMYNYVGQEIVIQEAFDSYAGTIWPAALALSQYLDSHRNQLNLMDKAVLEIGAGTGLLSIVASLLGAWVTATDLPDVLNNLRFNLSKNTTGRCRHTPQVAPLSWDYNLERTYPTSVYRYDYILAADVVYHHDFLDELLATLKHFCKPGTTLILANKLRMESDLRFLDKVKRVFRTKVLEEDKSLIILMATCTEGERNVEVEDLQRGEATGVDGEFQINSEKNTRFDGEVIGEAVRERECDNEETTKQSVNPRAEVVNEIVSAKDFTGEVYEVRQTQPARTEAWVPSLNSSFGKDVYHYTRQDIVIPEAIDSFGMALK